MWKQYGGEQVQCEMFGANEALGGRLNLLQYSQWIGCAPRNRFRHKKRKTSLILQIFLEWILFGVGPGFFGSSTTFAIKWFGYLWMIRNLISAWILNTEPTLELKLHWFNSVHDEHRLPLIIIIGIEAQTQQRAKKRE